MRSGNSIQTSQHRASVGDSYGRWSTTGKGLKDEWKMSKKFLKDMKWYIPLT